MHTSIPVTGSSRSGVRLGGLKSETSAPVSGSVAVIWPATACVEMLLAAAHEVARSGDIELLDLELRSPLVLTDDACVALQTVLRPIAAGGWSAEIFRAPPASCLSPEAGGPWLAFAAARLMPATGALTVSEVPSPTAVMCPVPE